MSSKFKANVKINNIKINCLFEITNHFLKICITDKTNEMQSQFELIKALFISLNYSKTYEIFINYAFINNIKTLKENNNNCVLIEINNPIARNIYILILNDIKGISFLFKKKIDLNQIVTQIKKKMKEEIKCLIYGFNNMIFDLRDFKKNKNIRKHKARVIYIWEKILRKCRNKFQKKYKNSQKYK